MKKRKRLIRRIAALFLVLLFSIESFGAIVSDNDGSAFITKAEFDSLKNDFQSQIDQYNTSIDQKIDGAIAAYLAGIRVSTKDVLPSLINSINGVVKGYGNMNGWPFTNGSINITTVEQTPDVWATGTFVYQSLACGYAQDVIGFEGCHHAAGGLGNTRVRTGAGTSWTYATMYGAKCLMDKRNLYQRLNFTIADGAAEHRGKRYGFGHTYENWIRNNTLNLEVESVNQDKDSSRWKYFTGSGWQPVGLASGGAYLTLAKSMINTLISNVAGNCSLINVVSTTKNGYWYDQSASLESLLSWVNPKTPTETEKKSDNYEAHFPVMLCYNHADATTDKSKPCQFGEGADNHAKPATQTSYEKLYWYKQFVNTSSFSLAEACVYPATLIYGNPVYYYNGLPICSITGNGTIKLTLEPVDDRTSGTKANRMDLCFRLEPFENAHVGSDATKNYKNVKYREKGSSVWLSPDVNGACNGLVIGRNYEFEFENVSKNKVLWVKPSALQNTSSPSTQVYAYIQTTGDIIMESE